MNDTNDPILQALIGHAEDLQRETGGKLPVEMWAWTTLEPDVPARWVCKATVGLTGKSWGEGYSTDFATSKAKALEAWRHVGSPVDLEIRELAELAERLGYTITPKAKE